MTAAQVTACHLFPTDTHTFQRLDTVLQFAKGKGVIMLTVKEDKDYPRTIEIVLENKAQDYVFLETKLGALQTVLPKTAHHDEVWINAELGSSAQLPALWALKNPRVRFVELNGFDVATVGDAVEQIHAAGLRAFASSKDFPSVEQHKQLFVVGFDVLMAYNLVNGVQARQAVNAAGGVMPP